MLHILKRCGKEIAELPEEVRSDLADAIARLQEGHTLSMPLSRPMPSIGPGVHELRLKDRSGVYRVIYLFAGQGEIWILHAFAKKTQQTSQRNLKIAIKRLREVRS